MGSRDASVFRDTIILQNVRELVTLAAVVLDVRFAILRLFDGTVIANDDAAPIAAVAEESTLIPGMRFYAAAPVLDDEGHTLGTLSVLDQGTRELTWSDQQILRQLGKQVARWFDADVRLESVETQLQRLKTLERDEQAEQLRRLTSLGRLLAQVAHDFNNVLMGIQPFAEAVQRHAADPRLVAAGDAILSAIGRGKRITTDILRFGRPAQLVVQTVDVSSVVRQAIDEIRPSLPSNVILETAIADSPLYIHGDAAQLAQVLVNLMLNAIEAMRPDGGTMKVTAHPTEGHDLIHVAVCDTGEGIAHSDLPHIFEPLFTTKSTGTGLGLSVVWQIVTAHHGRVSAESVPGRGTTLHLHLPAIAEPSADEAPAAPKRERQSGDKVCVLLVEDDPTVAGGLQLALQSKGFEVSVATSGAEVLPRMAERKPDVVVLDLSLPDEDGQSIYERIVALSPMPVIFSSGYASDADVARMRDNRSTAFLMKPYAAEELLQAIDQLLDPKDPDHDLPN